MERAMSEAINNLLPRAVTPQAITLVRMLAKREVTAWLKQGLKPFGVGERKKLAHLLTG
jgi:hypothetical protein